MKELDYALGRILYATTGRDLDENSADAAVLAWWCLCAKDSVKPTKKEWMFLAQEKTEVKNQDVCYKHYFLFEISF